MRRAITIAMLTLAAVTLRPAPASADLTGFLGFSPTVDRRSAKGVAIGVNLIVVGFEIEYSKIAEDEVEGAPGLSTGMGNILILTPTYKMQLYATTGAGIYRESYRTVHTTHVATNLGAGAKLALAGPIRLRLDYRVFHLNGTPVEKRVQRFYGGLSIAF